MPEIHLPVFEGPLELLLHLIERDDLDITAVSLVTVTDQYLGAIRTSSGFDPHALAEFVAIGAKLIYLKSKALLPRDPGDELVLLEDDEVGRELVDLLIEYRRFGEIADILQGRQEAGLRVYPRLAPAPPRSPDLGLEDVTADALFAIMLEVLAKVPEEPKVVIPRDGITLSERIRDFRAQLRRRGRISFRRVVSECRTRIDVIISFLAVLELLKAGECDVRQAGTWGDIEVVAVAAVSRR